MQKTTLTQNVTAKFGGTSLATAIQCLKVKDIILGSSVRKYIVVSAPGKAHLSDKKVTDILIHIHANIKAGKDWKDLWTKVITRFSNIIDGLGLTASFEMVFDDMESAINANPYYEYIVSRGEYLQAKIMTALLNDLGHNAIFIDAADCIAFNTSGAIDYSKTCKLVKGRYVPDAYLIFPGFYGTDPSGRIRIFSRGGSDITGALIACALNSAVYENWTDVSGFYTANPLDVPNARSIKEMTYQEARALSYAGASVLHQETVSYLVKNGISINIRNTNMPADTGTTIASAQPLKGGIVGIAGKKDFVIFTIEKMMMNDEVGFGRKLLSILEKAGIPYDHQVTGIDTISLVIDKTKIPGRIPLVDNNNLEKLSAVINSNMRPDKITVIDNVAAITTVVRNTVKSVNLLAKFSSTLESNKIPTYINSQEINGQIISVIDSGHLPFALKSLHNAFFENP